MNCIYSGVLFGIAMKVNDRIGSAVRWITSNAVAITPKLMGVLLIIYAVVLSYIYIMGYDLGLTAEGDYIVFTAIFLLIAFGTLILLDFSNNLGRAIGFYALAIGSGRFLNHIQTVLDPHGYPFLYSLITAGMAVNMMITGFTFVRGSARSRTSMTVTTSLMLIATLISLYYNATTYEMDLGEIFELYPDQCIICIMYALLILMIGTEQVRLNMPSVRYQNMLGSIRRVTATEPESYILRSDAKILEKAFEDRSSWSPVTDGGPAECEYVFTVTHRMNDVSYVRAQKWKDSEKIHLTLTESVTGSMLYANRVSVSGIRCDGGAENCSHISFFGDGGLAVTFNVRDEVEEWQ